MSLIFVKTLHIFGFGAMLAGNVVNIVLAKIANSGQIDITKTLKMAKLKLAGFGLLQLVTGLYLMKVAGYAHQDFWISASMGLLFLLILGNSFAKIQQGRVSRRYTYLQLFNIFVLILILYLMVEKPEIWV